MNLLVNEVVPSKFRISISAAQGGSGRDRLTGTTDEGSQKVGDRSERHCHTTQTMGWQEASCFLGRQEPLNEARERELLGSDNEN